MPLTLPPEERERLAELRALNGPLGASWWRLGRCAARRHTLALR